jgi:hypothetical protein
MTYLNQTTVVPGDKQLSVVTNKATSRDVLKSRDGLGYFLYPRGIYMHSSSRCDRISMWFRVCEMDRSDGSVFLDKDRVFKRSPVARFYAMFFWSRSCVFTWDDRLVIHTAATQSERISFFTSHVLVSTFHRLYSSPPRLAPFSICFSNRHKMLLYSDILTGDEMFSDAFPMFVPCRCVRCYSSVDIPLQQSRGRRRLRGRLCDDHGQRRC